MLNYNLLKFITIGAVRYMKSCFFIGHREADERILPVLRETILRLITEENVTEFFVGGYGGFDRLAGFAVKQIKEQNPQVSLRLLLPYHPADRPVETPDGYDGTYYPEGLEKVPKRYAIVKANKLMIDSSDWLVAYVSHGASNSGKLLEYALLQQKLQRLNVLNLTELLTCSDK